jgi:hypothetical protein
MLLGVAACLLASTCYELDKACMNVIPLPEETYWQQHPLIAAQNSAAASEPFTKCEICRFAVHHMTNNGDHAICMDFTGAGIRTETQQLQTHTNTQRNIHYTLE